MNDFIQWAKQNNWQIVLSDGALTLPEGALQRYKVLPAGYLAFLRSIKLLANEADTSWFLCADDFLGEAGGAAWQAESFEKISLEAAGDDEELQADITGFWDAHIPIVFCLSNGYEYYAIRLEDGVVVNGTEPEFEETTVAAPSFTAFLEAIQAGSILL